MKPVDYVAIVIRFLSIALFLYGLQAVGATIQFLIYDDLTVAQGIVYLLHVLIPFIIAIFLWTFPNIISRKIIGDQDLKVTNLNPNDVLSVLIASIGAFTLLSAFTDAWYWVIFTSMLYSKAYYGAEVPLMPNHISDMWATGIELVLSILLILKCKTIANFIIKVSR